MLALLDQAKAVLDSIPGADLRTARRLRRGALLAQNVEFDSGSMRVRRGYDYFSFDPSAVIARLFDWFDSTWHRLIYYVPDASAGGSFTSRNLTTPATNVILASLSTAGIGAVMDTFGSRLFFNSYGAGGIGADAGYVWNGLLESGNPVVDTLFQAPINAATFDAVPPAFTEPVGGGTITAGLHRYGLIWATRNGYETAPTIAYPSPPYLEFTATGDELGRIVLDPDTTWPDWVRTARFIMTTVVDLNTYYFTGVTVSVPHGTSSAVTINFDIDDTTLAQQPEATDWFDLSDGGAGSPKLIFKYGERMCYVIENPDSDTLSDVSDIFLSEPNQPQWITANRHLKRLPGNKQVTAHFELGGNLYLLGPTWTYVMRDTTDYPVNWPAADLVDEKIGTLSPHGTAVNVAKGVGWIASIGGLYLFRGGSYSHVPVSHFQQSDWERINWNAPTGRVTVIDDAINQQVKVYAPLDDATTQTHEMTWDYQEGFSLDSLAKSYSLNPIPARAAAIVRNPSTQVPEVWIAKEADERIHRQKSNASGDADLYDDNDAGIDAQWIGPAMPGPGYLDHPVEHRGAHFGIRGGGQAVVKCHSADLKRTNSNIAPIELEDAPERVYYRSANMQSEAVHWEVGNGARAGHYFELSRVTHYHEKVPWVVSRGG